MRSLNGLLTRLKRLECLLRYKHPKTINWGPMTEEEMRNDPFWGPAMESQEHDETNSVARRMEELLAQTAPLPIGLKELSAGGQAQPVNRLECEPSRNGDGHE